MNDKMFQKALEAMQNPDVIASLRAEMEAKAAARIAFRDSDTFRKMCATITSATVPTGFDSEEASYFEDKVRARLGWDFVSTEDIRQFIRIVADPDASTVLEGSFAEVPESKFGGITFQHFGLHVFMMFGQGTFVSVSNGLKD